MINGKSSRPAACEAPVCLLGARKVLERSVSSVLEYTAHPRQAAEPCGSRRPLGRSQGSSGCGAAVPPPAGTPLPRPVGQTAHPSRAYLIIKPLKRTRHIFKEVLFFAKESHYVLITGCLCLIPRVPLRVRVRGSAPAWDALSLPQFTTLRRNTVQMNSADQGRAVSP